MVDGLRFALSAQLLKDSEPLKVPIPSLLPWEQNGVLKHGHDVSTTLVTVLLGLLFIRKT